MPYMLMDYNLPVYMFYMYCVIHHIPVGHAYILSPVVSEGQAYPAGHTVQLT